MGLSLRNNLPSVILSVLPILVLAGVIVLQTRYDATVAERFSLRAPVHRSIMPATVVRHLAFGFDAVLADYYWVTAVQAFIKWDRRDAYYSEYFHVIAALDPKFAYPYLFGILTIPSKGNPTSLEWLLRITEEGIAAFPDNWRIPFSAATQFHIIGKDNAQATRFLAVAAAIPNAPEIVHRSYAIYLMRDASDYKKSRELFMAIRDTADNAETKKIADERIALLDFVEVLEGIIAKYYTQHGVYPSSVDVLVRQSGLKLSQETLSLVEKFSPSIEQTTGKILLR